MLDRDRLVGRKRSKTQAVTSLLDAPLPPDDVHVGPSDHIPWLGDRKWAQIRLDGTGFGGLPLTMEVRLEVGDSPSSGAVVVDAVRYANLALDGGVGGVLDGPSAWYMKSPPHPCPDDLAQAATRRFIAGEA